MFRSNNQKSLKAKVDQHNQAISLMNSMVESMVCRSGSIGITDDGWVATISNDHTYRVSDCPSVKKAIPVEEYEVCTIIAKVIGNQIELLSSDDIRELRAKGINVLGTSYFTSEIYNPEYQTLLDFGLTYSAPVEEMVRSCIMAYANFERMLNQADSF
jgi:hypothetical protein